jgi:hypothetical protein
VGTTNPRDSETYHLAFVDPSQNNGGAVPNVAEAIAHEAGHTFGLAHVRTDGLKDPANLDNSNATIPDIMSYNRVTNLEYFADQSLTLTNKTASGDPASLPVYGFPPTMTAVTQDSFVSLSQVLRSRSSDSRYHVADVGAIDYQHGSQYVHPDSDDMVDADSVITEQGTITRLGDYDVYRWTAPTNETINFGVTGQGGLDPLVLVYDNSGQLQWQRGGNKPADSTDLLQADNGNKLLYYQHSFGVGTGSLSVQAGNSYYFVVGAHDSASTGNYTLSINQLPSFMQLSGSNLSINGNQLGANATETLTINTDAQGRILATLNGQTAQLEPWQVSSITVNSLGGNNTINVERLPTSVSLALSPVPAKPPRMRQRQHHQVHHRELAQTAVETLRLAELRHPARPARRGQQ